MVDFLNIRSNIKIFFEFYFDIQKANYNLLNKYFIYKLNKYIVIHIEDYSLWNFILIDYIKFEAKNFDKLDKTTLGVIRDY